METISFIDFETNSRLKAKKAFKAFLHYLFQHEHKTAKEIKIIFCTDEFLLRLNEKFLHHNFYTDTLTFPFSHGGTEITGEIYISIDRIRENANKLRIAYQTEVKRVIIHSCLHLCGFKDKPKKEAVKMLDKQEEYLSNWLFHVEQKQRFT